MDSIDVIPSRELRNNYASVLAKLEDHDHVVITNRGKGQSVLINFADYALFEEYLHQKYAAEALREAEDYEATAPDPWLGHEEFWGAA
jgi:prevent-host-death family protein